MSKERTAWRTGRRLSTKAEPISSWLDEARVPELEQALRDFKAKTQQEAIYLEIQRDVDVRFI